jgi:ubiquinone/menaquinone biosynthesis C-methylase UbiE
MISKNQTHYQEHSEEFGNFAEGSFSWRFIEKPAFDKNIGIMYKPEVKVLDIGCGTGRVAAHLVSKGVKPSHIIGIDPSDKMLNLAKKRGLGIGMIKGSATKLPFGSDSFDLVVSNMVIHELSQEQFSQALSEIARVLKPGGIFFFVDAHPSSTPEKVDHVGQWIDQYTPWGTYVKCFVHDFDLLTDMEFTHGLKLEYSGTLEVSQSEEAKKSADYKKYVDRPSRFAAKLVKTS